MSIFNDPNHIPANYGVKIAGGLIAYFVLMQLSPWGHIVELRLFNLVIQSFGIYFALKKFKETHGSHINYFRALITGVTTAAIGSLFFSIFLFVYMSIDKQFMVSIVSTEAMGRYLNPYISAFIVLLEGVFSGLLVTFVLNNYFHTDEVSES